MVSCISTISYNLVSYTLFYTVISLLSCNIYHLSPVIFHLSSVICHLSCIMYHLSFIIYHLSRIIYYLSSIIYNLFNLSSSQRSNSIIRLPCDTLTYFYLNHPYRRHADSTKVFPFYPIVHFIIFNTLYSLESITMNTNIIVIFEQYTCFN